MITCLLVALVIAALTQPNAARLFAAVAFVGITIAHEFILSGTDGAMYYGTSAALDLSIIAITSKINPIPKMVLTLHKVCMVSIMANFAGWILWFLYLPPTLYDASFVVIYTITIVTLLGRSALDVGHFALHRWISCFLVNRRAWGHNTNQHQGTA